MRDWSPINTAPGDGSLMWMFWHGSRYIGRVDRPFSGDVSRRYTLKACVSDDGEDISSICHHVRVDDPPTHWAPLIALPERGGGA